MPKPDPQPKTVPQPVVIDNGNEPPFEFLTPLKTVSTGTSNASNFRILPGDDYLFYASDYAGRIKLETGFDTGKFIGPGPGEPRGLLDLSPDGSLAVTATGQTKNITVWDFKKQGSHRIAGLNGHNKPIRCAYLLPDGKRVISSAEDDTIRIWDIATEREIEQLDFHEGLNDLAISPDGKRLAILKGFSPTQVLLWDLETRKPIAHVANAHICYTARFTPDGKYLVVAGIQDLIVIDMANLNNVRTLKTPEGLIKSFSFSPDGRYFAVGSGQIPTRVYEFPSLRKVAEFSGPLANSEHAEFASDSRTIYSYRSNSLCTWKVPADLKVVSNPENPEPMPRPMLPVGGLPLQMTVVKNVSCGLVNTQVYRLLPGEDKLVLAWNAVSVLSLQSGQTIQKMAIAPAQPLGPLSFGTLDFLPNGIILATATGPTTRIDLWNLLDSTKIGELLGHTSNIRCVRLLLDGKHVVSSAADNTIRIWNIDTQKEVGRLGENHDYHWLVVAPDGKHLVTLRGSNPTEVALWDLETRKKVKTLLLIDNVAMCAAFTPDGKHLIVPGDRKLAVVDLKDVAHPRSITTSVAVIKNMAISPDGRWIAAGSYDIPTRIYEFPSLQQVAEFSGPFAQSPDLMFAKNSRTIYTIRDRNICTWEIPATLISALPAPKSP
jgi:WD40 repeat protein